MSAIAARTLVVMGYNNVYNLTAGMKEWQAAGYELLDKGR
jgi:rhodanese-related sulfurtransferase